MKLSFLLLFLVLSIRDVRGKFINGKFINRDDEIQLYGLEENKLDIYPSSRFRTTSIAFCYFQLGFSYISSRVCTDIYISFLSTFKIGALRFSNRETCARDFL